MQVTIDIPEPLYLALHAVAAAEHRSVEEVLLNLAADARQQAPSYLAERKQVRLPLIAAADEPGTLDLSQNLNDAFFE